MRFTKISPTWLILTLALIFAACAGSTRTKIQDIHDYPSRYNNKVVSVRGEVVQTFAVPFLNQSIVRIDDGTGKIWVKPKDRVPFKGDKLRIKGKVKVGLTIANKNFGFVVVEGDDKENKRRR